MVLHISVFRKFLSNILHLYSLHNFILTLCKCKFACMHVIILMEVINDEIIIERGRYFSES